MTSILETFERDGFRFRIQNDQLGVCAPGDQINPEVIEKIRALKSEIRAECRLRDFATLVQHNAADHQVILEPDSVMAELDDRDRAELISTDLSGRQAWAEMLANRLSQQRIHS